MFAVFYDNDKITYEIKELKLFKLDNA